MPEVLGVGQLHRRAKNALAREMRGQTWVKGEIKALRQSRGSLFITLVEPGEGVDGGDASVDVAVWPKRNAVLSAQLQAAGVNLAAGVEVRVCGMVTLSKIGRLAIELHSLDVEALAGRQLVERRQLLQALRNEGLFDRNRQLVPSSVPLRIALVTSEGSEGSQDFLGQLERSPFAFSVTLVHTPVQGPAAARAIAKALEVAGADRPDVVALVRGGGGELEAFDKEPVARAIAACPVPVWTGIGHTGDKSVADEIAYTAYITPTECGHALVNAVATYKSAFESALSHIWARTRSDLRESELRLHADSTRVHHSAQMYLANERAHLGRQTAKVVRMSGSGLERAKAVVAEHRKDIRAAVGRDQERRAVKLGYIRAHLNALDPKRPLQRGYSLTFTASGRLIASAADAGVGEEIVTELRSGRLHSTVSEAQQATDTANEESK